MLDLNYQIVWIYDCTPSNMCAEIFTISNTDGRSTTTIAGLLDHSQYTIIQIEKKKLKKSFALHFELTVAGKNKLT